MAEKKPVERLAFTHANPSKRYEELGKIYRNLHREAERRGEAGESVFGGGNLFQHIDHIRADLKETGCKSLLDYGSGRAAAHKQRPIDVPSGDSAKSLKDYWELDKITCYDPWFAPLSKVPSERFDAVICTDVLQHCAEDDLDWVLTEIFDYAKRYVFLTLACFPAKAKLENGESYHVTVHPPEWWRPRIFAAALGRSGLIFRVIFHVVKDGRLVQEEWRDLSMTASAPTN